jgi:flagellar motility protein MotE (MotC chaperone)
MNEVTTAPVATEATETPAAPPQPSAAERAAKAAERARQAAAQRREQERALHETSMRARQLEAEHTAYKRQQEEREHRYRQDPSTLLRDYGVDPRRIAQEALEANTPEGQLRALKAELEAERQARSEYQTKQEQALERAKNERILNSFKEMSRDAQRWPTVANADPELVLEAGKGLAARLLAKTGTEYTHAEILDYLESKWVGKPSGTAPTEKTETLASSKTVTPTDASQRLETSVKPARQTDREQRRELAKLIEASRAGK